MSDEPNDLEALRREVMGLRAAVAELRAGLQEAKPRGSPQPAVRAYLYDKLREEAARKGAKAGAAVFRVVFLNQLPSYNISIADEPFWYDAASLPPPESVIEFAATFANNPLAVRALYQFMECFFEGREERPLPITLTKAELATALGIGETELENALRPLVADGTLRWSKTADGDEFYEWVRNDRFLQLLAIVRNSIRDAERERSRA